MLKADGMAWGFGLLSRCQRGQQAFSCGCCVLHHKLLQCDSCYTGTWGCQPVAGVGVMHPAAHVSDGNRSNSTQPMAT